MLDDLEARIRHPQVRVACDVLLRGMSEFPEFDTRYLMRGPKKAVHFVIGRYAPYAFIANAEWLLWYFRKPGVTAGFFTHDDVFSEFPAATFSVRKDPSLREITLKVVQAQDARELLGFVARHRVS